MSENFDRNLKRAIIAATEAITVLMVIICLCANNTKICLTFAKFQNKLATAVDGIVVENANHFSFSYELYIIHHCQHM